MTRLSVCIITFNEEKNLARCLESIKKIADEIVIVDSGSTDETLDVAKKYKTKIYERRFDNYANQKNYAVVRADGEWVLSLDADEVVTPELAEEITGAILVKDVNGYLIPRKNIIFGSEIKHTRWSPDKHVWLFRRGKGKWKGEVHEEVEVEGWVAELKNPKVHFSYETITDFLNMINRYTDMISEEENKKGRRFSYFMLFFTPTLSFFRRFFYKQGYLDGWRGFILSYLMALYRMTSWIKIWEQQEYKKNYLR